MNQRFVILDTETTGLKPSDGHRIIEIGCIEMIDRKVNTDQVFHHYLDPERAVDQGAAAVHGITFEKLQGKPKFIDIMHEFLAFIKDSVLIIHNAPFDVGFIEHELKLAKHKPRRIEQYADVIDTLVMARHKHPGQRNSLDALCKRYDIDNKHRTLHGALLDAEILARVYLAMTGGQGTLFQESDSTRNAAGNTSSPITRINEQRPPLTVIKATAEEEKIHAVYMASLTEK